MHKKMPNIRKLNLNSLTVRISAKTKYPQKEVLPHKKLVSPYA